MKSYTLEEFRKLTPPFAYTVMVSDQVLAGLYILTEFTEKGWFYKTISPETATARPLDLGSVYFDYSVLKEMQWEHCRPDGVKYLVYEAPDLDMLRNELGALYDHPSAL